MQTICHPDSKPILLGKRHSPLDFSQWNLRCEEKLGKIIPFGTQLTKDELRLLGFVHAAEKI